MPRYPALGEDIAGKPADSPEGAFLILLGATQGNSEKVAGPGGEGGNPRDLQEPETFGC